MARVLFVVLLWSGAEHQVHCSQRQRQKNLNFLRYTFQFLFTHAAAVSFIFSLQFLSPFLSQNIRLPKYTKRFARSVKNFCMEAVYFFKKLLKIIIVLRNIFAFF